MTDTPKNNHEPENSGLDGEAIQPAGEASRASAGPVNETVTGTLPQASTTNSKKGSGKVAAAVTAGIAGLAIGGLVVGLVMAQSNSENTDGLSASSDIWHSVDSENLPDGWEQIGAQGGETALELAQSPITLASDNNCHFTVTQSFLEAPEFSGTPADYHAVNLVLGYGSYRDATDTELKQIEIETSEGIANFWSAAYTLEYDIDGDGENDSVREARLAHAYPESTDAEGRIPVTEIGYVCQDSTQFSDDEIVELASAFTFNNSGQTPPALPEVEEPEAGEVEESPEPTTEETTVESEPNEAEESPTSGEAASTDSETTPTDGETTANPDDVVDERDATEAPSDVETSGEIVDATEGNQDGVEGNSDQ